MSGSISIFNITANLTMQLLTFAAIAALSSVAIAQTPPGFSPGTNKGLNVTYSGGKTVSPPGKAFAKDGQSSHTST